MHRRLWIVVRVVRLLRAIVHPAIVHRPHALKAGGRKIVVQKNFVNKKKLPNSHMIVGVELHVDAVLPEELLKAGQLRGADSNLAKKDRKKHKF